MPGDKLKGVKHVLTNHQTIAMGYYVFAAIMSGKGDKELVKNNIASLPGHIFDVDHSMCGTWCTRKMGDHTHVPFRLGNACLSPEHVDANPEVFVRCEQVVRDVIDKNYLAPAKLEEIYHRLVTSYVESFNRQVASKADKRIYLGQFFTYRIMVAIAVPDANVGPTWVTEVKRRMNIGVSNKSEELMYGNGGEEEEEGEGLPCVRPRQGTESK